VASTFHSLVRSEILASTYKDEFASACKGKESPEIFAEIYPLFGELAIIERAGEFDTLIVDEAQDLVTPANMGILNALVRGGLAGGRWTFFGDFTRQAIYKVDGPESSTESAIDLLHQSCPAFPVVPLKLNCRNSRQIGEETALLSGFEALPYICARLTEPALTQVAAPPTSVSRIRSPKRLDLFFGARFRRS
jgi:hypothetical protein